jgi:hypothetical protein
VTLSGQTPLAAADEKPIPDSLAGRILSLLKPWWNYLPAVVLGWVLVEAVGGNMSGGERWLTQAIFFCVVLVAAGAGATVSAGISEVGFWRTFIHRLSVLGEFLYMGILGFLAALVYLAMAAVFDSELSHPGHPFGVAAAALLPLTRFWPFWIIPFMQPVEHDIQMRHSLGNYRRPAMATAWRMTREQGTFRHRTLPWFLALGAALAVTTLATEWGGAVGRGLLLYPVVLPLFTAEDDRSLTPNHGCRAARLLIWVCEQIGREPPIWSHDLAEDWHSSDSRPTVALCRLIQSLPEERRSALTRTSAGWMQWELAHWWMKHQRADEGRERKGGDGKQAG